MKCHEGLSIHDCGKGLWDLQVFLFFHNLCAYIYIKSYFSQIIMIIMCDCSFQFFSSWIGLLFNLIPLSSPLAVFYSPTKRFQLKSLFTLVSIWKKLFIYFHEKTVCSFPDVSQSTLNPRRNKTPFLFVCLQSKLTSQIKSHEYLSAS